MRKIIRDVSILLGWTYEYTVSPASCRLSTPGKALLFARRIDFGAMVSTTSFPGMLKLRLIDSPTGARNLINSIDARRATQMIPTQNIATHAFV
jgi:hypothetical protein